MADNNNTSVNSILGFSTQSLKDSVEQSVQQGKELENNINGVLKLQYPVFADKIDLAHSYGYTDQQIEPMLRKREQAALTFYSPDDINRVLKRTPQTIQQAAHIENMFRVNALRQATGTSLNDDEIHDRITASKLTGVPASVLISDNNIYEKVKPFAKMRRTLFDSVRIGLANYFRSFNTSKSENDYNNWILSLDDFQLQQAQNNGQLSNEYLDLIETTGLSPDDIRAYAAYKISRAQGWDKAVNSVIDFISPEPSPDPDSMIHSLFEVAPNVAAGIAEFWALKKIPGLSPTAILTFMGAWRGWRNSNEQVYADRIAQGDSVPEAYSKSNNPLGLISAAIHGATSFIVARTLGRPVQPFGIVGPVMQQAANIADASAFSAMGSMAASSFNDFRSEKNPDSEKTLQEGRKSALWTGLFGLFSSLLRGKTLLNQQRDFNTLRKINNVLENYGYSPINENFSFQDSARQIIGDLQKGIITHQEIIDLFSDMGVAHDNIYKFILRYAPASKALNKYSAVDAEFSDMNEQPVVDNNPPQNETVQNVTQENNPAAAPIVTPPPVYFSNNQPYWVFIPKADWESFNQTAQNNDIIPAAEVHETGEVMLNGQDFLRLQKNAPDFVERIKDNIRNSANGVTNRELSLSDPDNQQDDNSLNWNSPRIKTLRKKIFQQWREAGYTRGQAKSISDMITDFAINYSYRTGIDPEDAVRISITNRENIYPENPPAENSNTVHSPIPRIEHNQPIDDSHDNTQQKIFTGQNTDRIRTMRGTEIDVRYRIIDANDLITSTNDTGSPNPVYPQELQPRQRNREASSVQINRIANNLDPELLGGNRLASDGAPVIGPDLIVESGNGRVMGIRQAYRTGNAEFYREWIKNNAKRFGLNPDEIDNIQNPVLVRERLTDVDRVLFTREANESSIAQMSASELSANDADIISQSMLIDYNPDQPLESNRSFIQSFISKINKNELGAFLQADGRISSAGLNRIKNAIAAKAYRDTSILNRLSELYDDEIKNVSNALYDAAPKIAMIEDNSLPTQYSIRNDILQAVNTLAYLRKEGQSVDDFLSQIWLFSEDEISQEAKKILLFFDRNKRSRKKIASALNRYADLARQEAGNNTIIIPGLDIPAKSKSYLIDEAIKFAETGGQVNLFETYNQTEKFTFNPDNPDEHDPYNPYTWPETPEREKALPLFEELKKLLLQTDINTDKNLARNKNFDYILDEAIGDSPSELATKIHDTVEAIYNFYDKIPESSFGFTDDDDNEKEEDIDENVDELVHPFEAFYESDEYKKLNDKYQKLVAKGNIDPDRITRETDSDTLADINNPLDPYTWPDTPARLKALVIFPPLDKWFQEHEDYDNSDLPPNLAELYDKIWNLANENDDEYLDITYYEDEKINGSFDSQIASLISNHISDEFSIEETHENHSKIQQQAELNNTEEQIKSSNFKRWFGDWENDKQNSSKIVDDHGMPLILEHQTGEEFSVFDPMHEGAGLDDYETPNGIFLKDPDNGVVIENARFHMLLYANIRNPFIVKDRADIVHKLQDFSPYIEAYNKAKELERDYEEAMKAMLEAEIDTEEEEKAIAKATKLENRFDRASKKAKAILRQWLIDNNYDGMILENDEGYSDASHPVVMRTVIALHKNQVKSADKNSGAFSPDNDDVYDDGITTPQNTTSLEAVHDTELKDIPVAPDFEHNEAVLQDIPVERVPDEHTDAVIQNTPEQQVPENLRQPAIKGRISWQKDIPAYEQTSIMELSNTHKDPTTVIHEIGHHMAKLLFDAAQFKGVDGEIKDDIDAVLNHAGVSYNEYLDNKNGEKEKVHEDFADEFTKFAASGNAPNERLRRAFSRIRAWLIDLFRDLQRRNYKIDENMRRVFEHLFTSQERIDYTAKIGELASEAAALRELLSQAQNDLRSQIQNNAAIQKENENLQSQLDSAHDEISAQQEQTAQNSLAWEQTAEQAFIRGENTGEVYGIQEGRNYQKQKDKEVFDRALDREHDKLSQLREKKDAKIEKVREQKNNALERLEQKKNSQIERIKERYSDRLDILADRYDERIAKLKKRLEQISKIKPVIQRNIKQILRMAKSKSISYNVQQEINDLLSGFDLKKRSRETLSHRQDINELLKNNSQAASSLSPDEIRFANTTNIADMTLDDLRYLKWQVKVLYDKGRREFEQWQAEAKQRRTDIRGQLFDRLSRFNPPDEHIITSREDIGKQYKGVKGKVQKVKDWGSAVLRTPDRVFDILDGGGANYNGPWVENFIDIPREKINDAQNFINSRKDNMIQNLAILGFKISDFGKTAAVIDGQKFSFDKIMEIFLGMRNPKKAKAIIFGNFVNPRGYSPDQAIDVINQLISKLTPEHMKAAELVIKDHQDNFQRINNALISAFNKGMKQEVDYTSMHRLISQSNLTNFIDPDDEAAIRYGLSDSLILQKIETGFMLSRQNISNENQQPLDLGLFSNWMRDVSRHEFAAALGQTASDLMSVLLSKNNNRQTLMRMISDRFGNTMRKSVISIFNDTFTDNQRTADEFLRSVAGALSRNMSVAYISYNMGVYIMQAMSYPLFLMSASPDYMFSSIAQFFRNPRAFLDNVYSLSPTIKNMGRDPTDNRDNLMRSLNSSFWQKVINAGLEPTSIIDRITKAIGWHATYNTNIRRGLSHEKAIREADRAVRLTQPPSNTRDTMRITRNGSLAALKMKFTYALASAWNMTTYDFIQKLFSKDWNNIKSAFATLIGLALTATLIKFMHDGGPNRDNDEDIPQWVAGAFSEQIVNSIPLIGKDAMQSYNKRFKGKYGQSQFDAFNAPVDKVLNATGIVLKEDKSDEDYARLGSLVLEVFALSSGIIPYSGIKQTIRSLMMAADGNPLKGFANLLGFRQKE